MRDNEGGEKLQLETKSRAEDFTWDRRGWAKGEVDTAAQGVCERPELLFRGCFCCARLYISQTEIKICIKQWDRGGEPSWQFKKGGGEGGKGRLGERGWDTWSGESGCSDSSEAAEDEECRLFLPVQTSCPAASPSVVINTGYFPLSPFQSIDKSRVRPVGTMALSVAPSDLGWIATALVVGIVQEELLDNTRD